MLGVIVPARNEEKNIADVLENLLKCKIPIKNIYVIDNQSSDNTSAIAETMGVKTFLCEEIGYQAALKNGLKELKKRNYQKFLIIDGDNEIGIKSIERCLVENNSFKLIIGYRNKIKRISERIVNRYFKYRYGIFDLMCGLKCGDISLYNDENNLEFGIDFFQFHKINQKDICNFQIDLKERNETRLGNAFSVNIGLLLNLIKFIIRNR